MAAELLVVIMAAGYLQIKCAEFAQVLGKGGLIDAIVLGIGTA